MGFLERKNNFNEKLSLMEITTSIIGYSSTNKIRLIGFWIIRLI